MSRLCCVEEPLPNSKPELTRLAEGLTPNARAGDYAQAVMDLGATVCTPRNPACAICPLVSRCVARERGIAQELPRKIRKPAKPIRNGVAYVVQRADGALLVETRPPEGLLGGMLGWPTTDWGERPPPAPPIDADWQSLGAEVRHTFTHFHLRLSIRVARVSDRAVPERGRFMPWDEFDASALPTVMRKVHDLALPLPDAADLGQSVATEAD